MDLNGNMQNNIICTKCNIEKAVWLLMSANEDTHPFFCDNCVSRGCSCNWNHISNNLEDLPEGIEGKDWKWIEYNNDEFYGTILTGTIWTYIDEHGRQSPCCEYDYDKDGFDFNEES